MLVYLRNKFNTKYITVLIGILHLLLLVFRIYEIILNVYILEDLIEVNQVIYIILITLLQLAILTSLFVGAIKENYPLLLPWLCFTAPLFIMSTSYAVLYVATGDHIQSVINFTVIAIFWLSWYTVLKYYLMLKKLNKCSIFSNYKYSQLSEIAQKNFRSEDDAKLGV